MLDLRHRSRDRCEQRIKDAKDLGFLAVPHYSYAANRVWMHAVMLAGMLSSWAGLLGENPDELAAAKKTACDFRRNGYPSTSEQAKATRKAARSWWWLWDPGSLRARVLSTAATVARHARRVRVVSTAVQLTPACWPWRWQGSGDWPYRCSARPGCRLLHARCSVPLLDENPVDPSRPALDYQAASRHAWKRIKTVSAVRARGMGGITTP